jgi:hypothetical protein
LKGNVLGELGEKNLTVGVYVYYRGYTVLECLPVQILIFQWIGMVGYIPRCYTPPVHWGFYLYLGWPAGPTLMNQISEPVFTNKNEIPGFSAEVVFTGI